MSQRGDRFLFVDALRGIASLWVAMFHAHAAGHIPSLVAVLPTPILTIVRYGWVGVPIFFVLSGFVIAHSMAGYRVDGAFCWRFALRRSIRLDPPYWVSMAVAVAFGFLSTFFVPGKTYSFPSVAQVATHIAYAQEIAGVQQIQEVYWTLCREIQFYLVFCLLTWAAHSLGKRGMYFVFVPTIIVGALWAVFPLPVWRGSFLPQWHGFLLGMLACWVLSGAAPPAMLAGFAATVSLAIFVRGDSLSSVFSITCASVACLLFAVGRLGKLGTWLSWRPLQILGAVSYSLYLIHNPVSGAAFRVIHRLVPSTALGDLFAFVFTLGCAILAAWLLWRLVERPAQAFSKRIRLRREAAPAVSASAGLYLPGG